MFKWIYMTETCSWSLQIPNFCSQSSRAGVKHNVTLHGLRVLQYTWIMRFLACYVGIIKCPANPNPHQSTVDADWFALTSFKMLSIKMSGHSEVPGIFVPVVSSRDSTAPENRPSDALEGMVPLMHPIIKQRYSYCFCGPGYQASQMLLKRPTPATLIGVF